jgi:hypothetical protein
LAGEERVVDQDEIEAGIAEGIGKSAADFAFTLP